MKKIFYVFISMIFMFPLVTNAITEEEANDIVNSFDNEITIPYVNPTEMDGRTEENASYYDMVPLKFYLRKTNAELYNKLFVDHLAHCSYENDILTITAYYDTNNGTEELTKNVSVKYDSFDSTELSNAKQVVNIIDEKISLGGMNSINSLYHYGMLQSNDYNSSTVVARFPQLKKVLEQYPDYNYEILLDRGGGTPWWQERYAYVGIFKGDVLYAYKEVLLHVDEVIFVEKDKSGSLVSKATDRLKEYFGNDISITFDEEDLQDLMSEAETIEQEYNINVYNAVSTNLTLGENNTAYISIVETDKSSIDSSYVESTDKDTGVNIYTESYDVPIDSIVKVKNASNEEYVKKAISDNKLSIEKVFDIDLVKYKNKQFVKEIKGGLDIYFPIEDSKSDNKVVIYYINNDGEIGEKLNGEIAKINGKFFVKFTTNHLSTYAVELESTDDSESNNPSSSDTTTDPIESNDNIDIVDETPSENKSVDTTDDASGNPQTGDNIIIYIVMFGLSIIGLVGAVLFFKKKRFN